VFTLRREKIPPGGKKIGHSYQPFSYRTFPHRNTPASFHLHLPAFLFSATCARSAASTHKQRGTSSLRLIPIGCEVTKPRRRRWRSCSFPLLSARFSFCLTTEKQRIPGKRISATCCSRTVPPLGPVAQPLFTTHLRWALLPSPLFLCGRCRWLSSRFLFRTFHEIQNAEKPEAGEGREMEVSTEKSFLIIFSVNPPPPSFGVAGGTSRIAATSIFIVFSFVAVPQ
jgi:hypothetical protein